MPRPGKDPLADRRISSLLERSTGPVPALVFRIGWNGIGIVRALAHRRVPVLAVETRPRHPTTYTRLCPTILADNDEEAWGLVVRLAERLEARRPVLFLTADHDVVEAPERLRPVADVYRLLLPDPENVHRLMDKLAFADLAAGEGWPVPATFLVRDDEGWRRVSGEARFPIVVKPKYRTAAWLESGLSKVFDVGSPEQLESLLGRIRGVESEYVVQEWVPGPESSLYHVLGYFGATGEPLATFAMHKLRQWPPRVGSACVADPAEEPAIEELMRTVLGRAGIRGFGSIEVKRDSRDGRDYIIEPAVGRPILPGDIARVNGVDLVYVAYCHLTATPPPPVHRKRPGTRWFYLEGDVRTLLALRRESRLRLRDWLSTYRARRYFVDVSLRDPLPFAVAVWRLIAGGFRHRLRGAR